MMGCHAQDLKTATSDLNAGSETSVVSHQQAKSWKLANEYFSPERIDVGGHHSVHYSHNGRITFSGVVRVKRILFVCVCVCSVVSSSL